MGKRQTRVFLVPCSNNAAQENFQRTVLDRVESDVLEDFADLPFTSEKIPIWGTREGNRSTWEQIQEGDYLFFYQEGEYPYAARVLGTEENEPLGRKLWPVDNTDPWKYIIFLLDLLNTNIYPHELNEFAGYEENFVPRGFQTYREEGVQAIESQYGSVWDFITRSRDDHSGEIQPGNVDIHTTPTVSLSDEILEGLYFPNNRGSEILEQVNAALNAGKHIIFTGPPGTGKTEIARRVSRSLVDTHSDIYSGQEMTTATADWSTFETVGGYMPAEGQTDDSGLGFESGQILQRFKKNGEQQNELLVIDEINRADIDKAFGQLFTLLSGQRVQLPYKRDGEEIEIVPAESDMHKTTRIAPHRFVKPASWRILATMNSYDKTSLYEMSYAFMRRFSFIHVDAPELPENKEKWDGLIREYLSVWGLDPEQALIVAVGDIWYQTNNGTGARKLGPAIIEDIFRHVESSPNTDIERSLTQAITNYVFPQLEGVPERQQIVGRVAKSSRVQ